ncbi:MAG: hypothetical protein RL042_581 [Nitrospirota bacterium]
MGEAPAQVAQNVCPARPQPMKAPEASRSSPAHPELPRQLVSQVGNVEDAFEARTKLAGVFSNLLVTRGVERHIRVMFVGIPQRQQNFLPHLCGIFFKHHFGISGQGNPRAGLHLRLELARPPA